MHKSPDEIDDNSEAESTSNQPQETENLAQTDGNRRPLSAAVLLDLPLAQVVIPLNASSGKDMERSLFTEAGQSHITTADLSVPAFGGGENTGLSAETQGYRVIGQQTAVPQGGEAGISTLSGNPLESLTVDIEESRGVVQENAYQKGPSFVLDTRLNRYSPNGFALGKVGVSASNSEPVSKEIGGSSIQPEELQKPDIISPAGSGAGKVMQGTAIPTINTETMVGENGAEASRNFARGALGADGGIVSHAVIEGRFSGEAKIKGQPSGEQLQENNGLATKPDPNVTETEQAPHSLDGDLKTVIKEAKGDTQGRIIEEKPAFNNTALFVHSQDAAETREGNSLSNPESNGKLPSSEQICHQVRERLESGDYGMNKSSITLKLHPEELGELKINLRMEELRLKVDIVTDNKSVKEALMQNLDSLKDALSRQNISMDLFNVSADIRQGFQRGPGDDSRMTQNNRAANAHLQTKETVEDSAQPILNYGWENDGSLVSLVL
jgi:hypothetical protein